jgi:hypothetical protein
MRDIFEKKLKTPHFTWCECDIYNIGIYFFIISNLPHVVSDKSATCIASRQT